MAWTTAKWVVLVSALLLASGGQASERTVIRIAGSTTLAPLAGLVAQIHAQGGGQHAPRIEASGTTLGFVVLCRGLGDQSADVVFASRAMTDQERELCATNGVVEPVQFLIGYEGIVLSGGTDVMPMDLTVADIWRAVGDQVVSDGHLRSNPNQLWSDIRAGLPDREIEVAGPDLEHGTRGAFVDLVLRPGCLSFDRIHRLDNRLRDAVCATVRADGRWIDVKGDYETATDEVRASPNRLGVFGFSIFERLRPDLVAMRIHGVTPSYDTIHAGEYPLVRPLFVYAKRTSFANVEGFGAFMAMVLSDAVVGELGYLVGRGFVPVPMQRLEEERRRLAEATQ